MMIIDQPVNNDPSFKIDHIVNYSIRQDQLLFFCNIYDISPPTKTIIHLHNFTTCRLMQL